MAAPFDPAEYRNRLARVRARMATADLDVLVCVDPANLCYLTGYDGWSFYVPQAVALARAGGEPVWIGRAMDLAGARLTTYLGADNLCGYPEEYVDAADRHPLAYVGRVLTERGWGRGRVGVELDSCYYTARAHAELTVALPGATLVDAGLLVNWVRLIKSPAEVAHMRAAARIAERAMEAGIDAIAPGVRECDVAARVAAAQFAGTPEHFGDYPAAMPSLPSGARTAAPHLTWSGARHATGSVTYLELAGCHARYHAPLARTVYLGRPPAALERLAAIVGKGLETALDVARAGRMAEHVEAAWREVITRAGYQKASRIGYAVGLGYPPDWGERTVSLRPGDTTVLAPNMCFHMILGMWLDQWGYEISETFCVNETGPPEVLTQFPRRLFVKT
jgi:ectoine hydrolase